MPSMTMACASTVEVVVPSPAMSLVLVAASFKQLGAHILKRVFQLDFLGDGHAVVGDGGGAEFLVQGHVAAFGSEGGGHGFGQSVHTARQSERRASSENASCFAIDFYSLYIFWDVQANR